MRLSMLAFLFLCSHASEVKINLYAKKVMDIEVPIQNVLPHCSIPGDPEKKNSWLGVYVFHGDKIERLSERHQQLPKECEKEKKEMEKFLSKSTRVRVIGVEGGSYFEDTELKHFVKNPPRTHAQWWRFSRLITDQGCYGWEGCEKEPKLVEKDDYTNIYE